MSFRNRPAAAFAVLSAALILAASLASAQDADESRIRLEGPSWAATARGSFLLRPCPSARERGLAFCMGGDDAPPSAALKKFTRFTRLAGMFMGRVSALDVGNWRLRFLLDLR